MLKQAIERERERCKETEREERERERMAYMIVFYQEYNR